MTASVANTQPFATLRTFLRQKPAAPGTRCELCAASIGEHPHLLELQTRKIVCSCRSCAILFSSQNANSYRRVPRDVFLLADFALSDAQWDSLAIPINMAYFCQRTGASAPAVFYPSPAGATESLLPVESWQEFVTANPALHSMEPEVQCLLVNRITTPHRYFLAPIDECYRLVGLIRSRWRGFSGGADVWKEIGVFFNSLEERSAPMGKIADVRP